MPTAGANRPLIELPAGTRGLTAFALALGTFMQVLDTTIANVSLPTIAGSLGVSPNQGTWVITSFAVANGISVPLTGWLMQRYGVVRTFVVSVILFTLASFLCGMAWSFESLIAFRVHAGRGVGPDDSRLADAADVDLSGVAPRHGARDLVDDDAGCARSWGRCSAATSPTSIRGRGSS